MSTTRLVLVRHGESRAIVDEIVGGHEGCKGLTDEGRRQAQDYARSVGIPEPQLDWQD